MHPTNLSRKMSVLCHQHIIGNPLPNRLDANRIVDVTKSFPSVLRCFNSLCIVDIHPSAI